MQACCNQVELGWTQRVVDGQYADIQFCNNCGTVHVTESYQTPLRLFPLESVCVNCGGDLDGNACSLCRQPVDAIRQYHQQMAQMHPSGSMLAAARDLAAQGRHTLALKMASAEVAFGEEPDAASLQRIQSMYAMGEDERALDEAYDWAHHDGPADVYGLIAELEVGYGNMQEALKALEAAVRLNPDNPAWWADYAEMLVMFDDRPAAVKAASKGIHDPEVRERCIGVITEAGERLYANGQFAEALGACSLAGDLQREYKELAWLRARICASMDDNDSTVEWLGIVVKLDPSNENAQLMYESFAPPQKQGWFW